MATNRSNYGNGANYSTTSDALLCKVCKYGQIIETDSGNTIIVCRKDADAGAMPLVVNRLVTKCSLYEEKEMGRIWANSPQLEMEDGHCWIQKFVTSLGQEHVRVDTLHKDEWIVRGYDTWGTYNRVTKKWSLRDVEAPTQGLWATLVAWWQSRRAGEDDNE